MSDNDIVISTRNLCKVYKLYNSPKDRLKEALHPGRKKFHKEFYALKDINLEIHRGEIIGIVGKNGSGKSTLLKILSRVLTPTSGEFMVRGKVSSLLELGSGFNPELTGMENIFFYGTILGFSEEKIRSKLQEMIDFADIGDFIYQPLKTYSSGMRARLAFSVAINVDPDILILDEVLAVGDELFKRKCYARMETYFKGYKTILFVSHNISDINLFCSRSYLLDGGQVLLEGPSKLVTSQYQRFIFSSSENSQKVRDEINAINQDLIIKNELFALVKKKEIQIETGISNNITDREIKSIIERATQHKPYFLEGFTSKSKIEYKNRNIDIDNLEINTLNGEKVNVLISGQRYVFCYKVLFNEAAQNVVFGTSLKTEKGIMLSSSNSKINKIILPIVNINEEYEIKFHFVCNLAAGNYYLNAGVAIFTEEKIEYLNRVVDGLVFKVLQSEKNCNGIAYIDQEFEIHKLASKEI